MVILYDFVLFSCLQGWVDGGEGGVVSDESQHGARHRRGSATGVHAWATYLRGLMGHEIQWGLLHAQGWVRWVLGLAFLFQC